MYTQCPDCGTAFRVTAEVLRQAAGKVRCGGCSNAFNALEYLSEELPERTPTTTSGDPAPELTPDALNDNADLPKSISAEQSAALLKTLDQLAGSDIRIEDTGVEWRVLDESEATEPEANANDDALDIFDQPGENEAFDEPEVSVVDDISSSPVDELRFDDDTPLPDDFDLDSAAPYSPIANSDVEENDLKLKTEIVDPPADIALSEPEEWTDILGEFEGLAENISTAPEPELSAPDDKSDNADDSLQVAALSNLSEIEIEIAEIETEEGVAADLQLLTEDGSEPETEADENLNDDLGEDNSAADDTSSVDPNEDFNEDVERLERRELLQEPIVGQHTMEEELAALELEDATHDNDDFEAVHTENEVQHDHHVAPLSEDEQTINMLIDQDLMALAIEDKDGFASTMIIREEDAESGLQEKRADHAAPELAGTTSFETIVMEGESSHSGDDGKFATDTATAAGIAKLLREKIAEPATTPTSLRRGIVGGCIVLVVVLLLQVVHQSREALATIPAFNNTIGPIYRALGQPLQPEWDITGWRFEATKGSADGETEINGADAIDEKLTIYSRIGNNAKQPLPYPLIGISLTDRFEETIGNRILDPAEYLSNDLDPRKLVQPGNSFNAVITITSPSQDATGFKLNVCYRLSDGRLRCAVDDFK